MGKVYTTITVTNRIDQGMAERGLLSAEQVRSVTIPNVLMDTGATTLCLPPETIQQLGLTLLGRVPVETAGGVRESQVFRDASIALFGREGSFECLELPGGRQPLLGVIPMEALGVEPDVRHHTVRVLPQTTQDTYWTIL